MIYSSEYSQWKYSLEYLQIKKYHCIKPCFGSIWSQSSSRTLQWFSDTIWRLLIWTRLTSLSMRFQKLYWQGKSGDFWDRLQLSKRCFRQLCMFFLHWNTLLCSCLLFFIFTVFLECTYSLLLKVIRQLTFLMCISEISPLQCLLWWELRHQKLGSILSQIQ